jgi:hypothetical protein
MRREREFTPAERERLSLAHPEIFKDGAVCGFVRHFPGARAQEGYPRAFDRWPRDKRNAWRCGFHVGFHDWLSGRYPEFEQQVRQTLELAAAAPARDRRRP